MPNPSFDSGLPHGWDYNWIFAWTGQSLERWVTANDRQVFDEADYVLRSYFCPPGTFLIGNEQAVFDRETAIIVEDERRE
jgi:hypothetical protein